MTFKINSNSDFMKEVRNRRVLGPEVLELERVKDGFCAWDFLGRLKQWSFFPRKHKRHLLLL